MDADADAANMLASKLASSMKKAKSEIPDKQTYIYVVTTFKKE